MVPGLPHRRVHFFWSSIRFAEPQQTSKTTRKMMSLRIVIAILSSLLVMSQALPTAPAGNLQRRPVRSADDLKTSASVGYGYGYPYGLGYGYGGYGYGGYGYGGYGGGYGYGYPYYGGYHGYGYPFGSGYGYGGLYGGYNGLYL